MVSVSKLWEIQITLCRTFDGTKEEAIDAAEDDWEYFQGGYNIGEWNNKPIGEAYVSPINEWSKHIVSTHKLSNTKAHIESDLEYAERVSKLQNYKGENPKEE